MAKYSKTIGTLYGYANENNHGRYECIVYYDEPTRSGSVVTLPNVSVILTRYNSGYTTNRIAGKIGIGDSTDNVINNKTLNPAHSNSPSELKMEPGNLTVTTLASSFTLYVAVASTGHSDKWNNFQGNSPLELRFSISCPPAKPTFTTNPYITDVQETSFRVVKGSVNIESDITFSISPTGPTGTNTDDGVSYSNLTPGTAYTITQTAVTKNSGGGTNFTTTSTATETTYKFPYIESIEKTELVLGETQTAKLYNPLNRTVDFRLLNSSKAVIISAQSSKDSALLTIPLNDTTAALIGSSTTTGSVYYDVIYNNSASATKTGTVKITADQANPLWTAGTTDSNLITYKNTLSTAKTVTQSDYALVQGKSTWQYIINFSSYPARPRYGATSSITYEVSINGGAYSAYSTSGTAIAQAASTTTNSNVTISVRAKDSRGFYSSIIEKVIQTTPYNKPSGSIIANRINGYGDKVSLILYPNWSINQNTNIGTATWSYRLSTNSGWTAGGTNINTFNTEIKPSTSFSNDASWEFQVIFKDLFGTTSDAITAKVSPGVPIVFVDTTSLGLGVNTFPKEKGLAVEGMAELEKAKITKSIILGKNSRIEDYDNGTKTGVFWIGD